MSDDYPNKENKVFFFGNYIGIIFLKKCYRMVEIFEEKDSNILCCCYKNRNAEDMVI